MDFEMLLRNHGHFPIMSPSFLPDTRKLYGGGRSDRPSGATFEGGIRPLSMTLGSFLGPHGEFCHVTRTKIQLPFGAVA